MPYKIRFGNLNDIEVVSTGDSTVARHILQWKLQNQEIILAEDNNEIIGYLRLEHLWSRFPYIGLIIVSPECRGQGVGRNMLEYLEGHLRSKDLRSLYSSSQINEVDPQKWHRKMGFTECGIINGINSGNVGEVFFVKSV